MEMLSKHLNTQVWNLRLKSIGIYKFGGFIYLEFEVIRLDDITKEISVNRGD